MSDDHDGIDAYVINSLRDIKGELKDLRDEFEKYVTHHEFGPVKLLVYGFAALILGAVMTAVIAKVVG